MERPCPSSPHSRLPSGARSPAAPEPALVVASVMGRTAGLADSAAARFADELGRLVFASPPTGFPWSDHYSGELGPSPVRRFIAVAPLLEDPSRLPEIKRLAGRLEVSLGGRGGERRVNLDPGLLGSRSLVLASTRPRAHRIYLGRGVYGDLMLVHGERGFSPLPWTYPDYGSAELIEMFARLRRMYLASRRLSGGPPCAR